jgi:hypothetical protein
MNSNITNVLMHNFIPIKVIFLTNLNFLFQENHKQLIL